MNKKQPEILTWMDYERLIEEDKWKEKRKRDLMDKYERRKSTKGRRS